MTTCTPALLHQHADAIDHTAALGGWVDDRNGERHTLTPSDREQWARDAALLRAHAHQKETTP